jgi:hypothetical protein
LHADNPLVSLRFHGASDEHARVAGDEAAPPATIARESMRDHAGSAGPRRVRAKHTALAPPEESTAYTEMARNPGRIPLPHRARSVIVDCGRSARFIIMGGPVGERVLESTLGEESSFDCCCTARSARA